MIVASSKFRLSTQRAELSNPLFSFFEVVWIAHTLVRNRTCLSGLLVNLYFCIWVSQKKCRGEVTCRTCTPTSILRKILQSPATQSNERFYLTNVNLQFFPVPSRDRLLLLEWRHVVDFPGTERSKSYAPTILSIGA